MKKLLLFSGLLCSLLLFSCKSEPAEDLVKDEILDIRLDRDPDRINPMIYPKPTARQLFQNIFKPCADVDPFTLEMIPILIDEIPEKANNEDGSVSFTLRFKSDATWPNGSPITADDYEFTLKAIAHPKVNAPSYRSFTKTITSIQKDKNDPKVFTLSLAEDYFLALETVATIEVYPKYVYDANNALGAVDLAYLYDEANLERIEADSTLMAFAESINGLKYSQEIAIGAGPYQLKSYTPNQKIVLEEVADYWGDNYPDNPFLQSGPKELAFHIIPDKTSALNLLKEGDIDLISNIEGNDFINLKENAYAADKLEFLNPDFPRIYYFMLNTLSPELSDVTVREALSYLVDISTYIEVLEGGLGKAINSSIMSNASYYDKSLPMPEFNIEKANSLLDEAGWKDSNGDGIRDKLIDGRLRSLILKMSAAPGKLSGQMGQILKSDAAKAGVSIDLIEKTPKLFNTENIKTGDYHIAAQAISLYPSLYDPYQKWHSDNAFKGNNYSGYKNETLDGIIETIRQERDMEVLTPLYKQFQQIVSRDKPILYLYSPSAKIAYNKAWKVKPSSVRPGYFPNTATAN